MATEFGPTDLLYYAIADLKGWDEYLGDAQDIGGNYKRSVGVVLSGIILATGDEQPAIAVGGALDATRDGQGYLAVVFGAGIAYVDVRSARTNGTDYTISLHQFSEIDALTVRTRHNYFDGTETHPRHRGIEVAFDLAGHPVTLSAAQGHGKALTDSESINRAFILIRDSRG